MAEGKRQLLIGCGRLRNKRMWFGDEAEWTNLTTLDVDPATGADLVHDLDVLPYPIDTSAFDEIHAYEVLEHCGAQGDWRFFFAQFGELWRILRPDGLLFVTVPSASSVWAWGDPGHRRVIVPQMLPFLSRDWYPNALATSPASDYRAVLVGDWRIDMGKDDGQHFKFAMQAIK